MKIYYSAKDISDMLDVSVSKAYGLIKIMNQELEKEDFVDDMPYIIGLGMEAALDLWKGSDSIFQ